MIEATILVAFFLSRETFETHLAPQSAGKGEGSGQRGQSGWSSSAECRSKGTSTPLRSSPHQTAQYVRPKLCSWGAAFASSYLTETKIEFRRATGGPRGAAHSPVFESEFVANTQGHRIGAIDVRNGAEPTRAVLDAAEGFPLGVIVMRHGNFRGQIVEQGGAVA